METDNVLVQVTPDDISFVEKELAASRKPATTKELAGKLAYYKTAGERTRDVKLYDPACSYEVGDTICKEYDEELTIGAKVHEHFRGAVVLTVVDKNYYKDFGCEMLEVDYTGGGTFRKYIDYMKKAKTQEKLPANVGGANQIPLVMPHAEDPRLTELPMTERDIKSLERQLRATLAKSPAFFVWGDCWQLTSAQPLLTEDGLKAVEDHLAAAKASAATTELIQKFFGLEPSSDLFDLHCLTLNHLLETKYKKEFVLVQPVGWGKWMLKSVLAAMPESLPLSASAAALPPFESTETVPVTPFHDFPLKVYLGWREILSGGVKIPKGFNKELSHAREYVFTDADEKKNYTVYYFPLQSYFLGLREFFEAAAIPQGTSMTLEKAGPVQFNFWLKKSKKKIQVAKMTYETRADAFAEAGETGTLAMPNKIIYLEREQLQKLAALIPQRTGLDLKGLLILIFKHFSIQSANFSLHYLRAYHLIDILRRTTQEDVEFTLLNSPEFEKSDKKKGIFYYHETPSELPVEEEAAAAEPAEEGSFEAPGELTSDDFLEHEFTILEQAPPPKPAAAHRADEEAQTIAEAEAELAAFEEEKKPKSEKEAVAAPKKEKEKEKKKLSVESDRRPKTRKSERRVKEEEIEELESEREALFAEKGAADEGQEAPVEGAAGETAAAEAAKPAGPGPLGAFGGGMFAEKLKVALKKKREEPTEETDKSTEET
ncbi:MAG: hypothetical protein ACYDH3_11125 [Candidatus Aminicenantales bacterium]